MANCVCCKKELKSERIRYLNRVQVCEDCYERERYRPDPEIELMLKAEAMAVTIAVIVSIGLICVLCVSMALVFGR